MVFDERAENAILFLFTKFFPLNKNFMEIAHFKSFEKSSLKCAHSEALHKCNTTQYMRQNLEQMHLMIFLENSRRPLFFGTVDNTYKTFTYTRVRLNI